MSIPAFVPDPGEKILFRTTQNTKWYLLATKTVTSILSLGVLLFVGYSFLAEPAERVLTSFLPVATSRGVINLVFLGLLPLIALAWVVQDLAASCIAEIILTDQRLWVKGSPYYWSQNQIVSKDITYMTWRRDAVFIRQKTSRRMQVHMFPQGKMLVEAYNQFIKTSKTA